MNKDSLFESIKQIGKEKKPKNIDGKRINNYRQHCI